MVKSLKTSSTLKDYGDSWTPVELGCKITDENGDLIFETLQKLENLIENVEEHCQDQQSQRRKQETPLNTQKQKIRWIRRNTSRSDKTTSVKWSNIMFTAVNYCYIILDDRLESTFFFVHTRKKNECQRM